MSAETVGSVALFLEGMVFILLQESDWVSRMGHFGKYLTALFSGWVAWMSAATLILVFLPIVLPDKFKSSSAIPASYVWIGGALCF